MMAPTRAATFVAARLVAAVLAGAAVPAGAAPFAYITNQGSHDVSVIDLATASVVATVPVGRAPAGVVASSRAGRVYVSNPDSKSISVIDMRTHRVVDTLAAGDGPVGIDASPDGSRLYAADWFRDRLLVFDTGSAARAEPAPRTPIATIALGRAPAGVAASDRPGRVFVAERDDDSVALVDVVAQRVVARVRVGSHPFALLFDAPRQRLYALNVQSDDVTVLDTRERPQADDIRRPPSGLQARWPSPATRERAGARSVRAQPPEGVEQSGKATLAQQHPQADDIRRPPPEGVEQSGKATLAQEPGRLTVIATVKVGKAPYGAALAAGGRLLYVTNQHDDSVSVIDADTLSVERTLTGFGYPEGVAAHAGHVYVVNWMDDNVSVLEAASGRVVATIATGKNSRGFGAFIGAPPAR